MSEIRSCVIRTFPLEWWVQAQTHSAGSALGMGQPPIPLCPFAWSHFSLRNRAQICCLHPAWPEEQDLAKPHSLPSPEEIKTQLQVLSHLCLCSKILPSHGSILRTSTAVTVSWLNMLNLQDIPQKQEGRTERCYRNGHCSPVRNIPEPGGISMDFIILPTTSVTQQQQTQKEKK